MNEYYQQFKDLREKSTFKGQQWSGEREALVNRYSWAVPNEEALCYLSNFGDIIEVGAGSGYWAKCVNENGGNVRATDANPPSDTHTEVEEAYAYELELEDRAVLCVWPPVNDSMAEKVLRFRPSHMLYVGEKRGGCTANDGFFDELEQKYGLVSTIDIPSYAGVNDNLYHYVRKV